MVVVVVVVLLISRLMVEVKARSLSLLFSVFFICFFIIAHTIAVQSFWGCSLFLLFFCSLANLTPLEKNIYIVFI